MKLAAKTILNSYNMHKRKALKGGSWELIKKTFVNYVHNCTSLIVHPKIV